ncbi:hypothetical protein GCM10010145_66400 [Streptomyces ruber]|uniref:Uncharacterized protein n=2 Tax=Streptomyces TaxID=1883 RepID=A0A918BT12_9ACTN|nr:hypothetical protein GCM10010145_66400 [Streptomyces ruber]
MHAEFSGHTASAGHGRVVVRAPAYGAEAHRDEPRQFVAYGADGLCAGLLRAGRVPSEVRAVIPPGSGAEGDGKRASRHVREAALPPDGTAA